MTKRDKKCTLQYEKQPRDGKKKQQQKTGNTSTP